MQEGRKEGQTHASCKNVSHAEGNPESDGGSQEVCGSYQEGHQGCHEDYESDQEG